jgi:hypothetical protein
MLKHKHTKDERRIRACIGRMPGGAAESISEIARRVGFDCHQERPITMEDVADYLEAVVEQRTRFAEESRVMEAELRQLKDDLAAVRRVFGLPIGGA